MDMIEDESYPFLERYHGRPVVSQKKIIMRRQPGVINKSAFRAASKVTGRKPKTKHGKKVKISRKFAQKVKKVNAGLIPYGDYQTSHAGYIGFVVPDTGAGNTGVQFETYTAQDGSNQTGIAWPGRDVSTFARCMFGILASTGTAGLATIQGTEMLYFTPMKILNAASCLWNRKAPGTRNYGIDTGNLVTSMDKTTGLPLTDDSDTSSLKIEVINSYATWEMKNVSQRPVKVIIHELSPKVKFHSNMPLQDIFNLLGSTSDTSLVDRTYTFFNGGSAVPAANYGFVEPLFNVMKLDGLQWKGLRREMLIQPGEMCKHTIQGPRRTVCDYSKFIDGTNLLNAPTTWATIGCKGWSVACVVEVMVDPQFTSVTNDKAYRPTFRSATNKALNDPIQITVTERFKLRCPSVAGFMYPAVATVGTQQQLNMRKKKIRIDNYTEVQGQAAVTYSGWNEENPVTGIPPATQF